MDEPTVIIVATPMVCIDGRTIVIVRDPDDDDGTRNVAACLAPGWYTLDIEDGELVDPPSWWINAADIRAHHQELAEDEHMRDRFPADLALWDTVATIVEQAEAR